MELLVEHNAFQSINKCLKKESKNITDIEDFLQICIQLIFCDNIQLSNYVPDIVKGNSSELITSLHGTGFDCIHIINDENADSVWENIRQDASTELSNEIEWILQNNLNVKDPAYYLPDLSSQIYTIINNITEAIINEDINAIKGRLYDVSTIEKNDGAFVEIITQKEDILHKILRYKRDKGWDNDYTIKLISDSRVLQNSYTAKHNGLLYSPSVRRAKEELFFHQKIYNGILSIIRKYGNDRYGPEIKLPSIADFLIVAGKGNPHAILEETLKLKELFKPVREYIGQNKTDLSFIAADYKDNALKCLNQIAQDLFYTHCQSNNVVRTEPTTTFCAQRIFNSPVKNYELSDKHTNNNMIKPHLRCFTEIVKRMIDLDNNSNKYNAILKTHCSKQY